MFVFVTAICVALVVSFLCSIFESGLLSVGHAHVEAMERSGLRSGRILKKFKREIDAPIGAILIANTIAHTIGASVAGASYVDVFNPETLWIFTIVFTLAVLLITEIIPKTLGVIYATNLASPIAYGILFLTRLLLPLVRTTELISRSLRGGKQPPVTSAEEIRLLAMLGRNEGVVGARTAKIIEGATHLRDLKAEHVMVPRSFVRYLSASLSLKENLDIIRTFQHSRFPFSPTKELDDARGIVLTKDLLFRLGESDGGQFDWEEIVREPLFVPPSKPLIDLLQVFQSTRNHLAVVVNEYGGVDGILTLEDVLEEVVGEIEDESDEPEEKLVPRPDGSLIAAPTAELRKVCERLDLPWEPGLDVLSVGGLVQLMLGRFPVRGDSFEWRGARFEILSASARSAEEIRIVPPASQSE